MGMTSVRMPNDLMVRLERTAQRLRRSKGWIINDAVREYVEHQEHQARRLEETREALADLEEGRLIDGEAVMDWLESWGSENEKAPPR